MTVLAYHITWTTYGTWLPGDARGWVKWGEWGVKPPDPERARDARQRMVESAVVLTKEQRGLVEQTIREHCRIRGWQLHNGTAPPSSVPRKCVVEDGLMSLIVSLLIVRV